MMKQFVFTGPESSGKTTLSKQIAENKKATYVREFARNYLIDLTTEYEQSDLLLIAKGQFELQESAKKQGGKTLIFDTDLLTIKIWSEYKYGECDPWILNRILSNKQATYILCKPDFKWVADPLREHPKNREDLYQIYQNNLMEYGLNFIEIGGSIQNRLTIINRLI